MNRYHKGSKAVPTPRALAAKQESPSEKKSGPKSKKPGKGSKKMAG